MSKRDPWAAAKPRLDNAVQGLHRKDEALRETKDRDREGGDSSTIPLSAIKPRPHGDSRPLDDAHVVAVAESIIVTGLLQPVVVDRKSRLVCGGHRLAAIQYLKEHAPDSYARRFPNDQIPVRILIELDAETDRSGARAAELEENEKRKGFTKIQVLALAQSLREGGYRFNVGRPKVGEAALAPTLAVATGISLRTVRRYLADGNGDSVTISKKAPRATKALRNISQKAQAALKRVSSICRDLRALRDASLFTGATHTSITRVIAGLESAAAKSKTR